MVNALSPMPPFDWQSAPWKDFCSSIDSHTLPHAILLAGREGIGTAHMAVAMGQLLLCRTPLDHVACGKCRACRLLDANTHPDLMHVTPEEKGKAIKVDQIREISSFLAKTSQQGGNKVVIMEPTEAMNINAANALLKNLEEPSPNTIFILVTYQLHRVLPTIRSRCLLLPVPTPDSAQALAWLNSIGLSDAGEILEEAGGAPLRVQAWFEGGKIEERWTLIEDLGNVLEKRLEPLLFARKWSNHELLSIIAPMLRGVEMALYELSGARSASTPYRKLAASLGRAGAQSLFLVSDHLKKKKCEIEQSPNLNPALILESLALDWAAIIENT